MLFLFFAVLLLSSAALIYQDFKTRLISTWLILCFGIANLGQYLVVHSWQELAQNVVFCSAYFLLSYLSIHLYFFIKLGKFQKIMNESLGWGDLWIALVLGSCLSPTEMIFFFTFSFVVSITIQFIFFRKDKTIALAGMLLACNAFYLLYTSL